MRPHPTPKIRDEGLGGASKTMDDNLSVFGKIVKIVRPLLHHSPALGEVLRVVVGGANLFAFVIMPRYWKRSGETRNVLRDGWMCRSHRVIYRIEPAAFSGVSARSGDAG